MNIHAPMSVQMWFTAQEMADAAAQGLLPDLPESKRGINDLATRENWSCYHALVRPRGGREGGGGFEYHIDVLPLEVRLCYLTRFLELGAADMMPPVSPAEPDGLTARARLTRDVKVYILRRADQFRQSLRMTALVSDAYFADMFNTGKVPMPEWSKDSITGQPVIKNLSARTLMRWRQMSKERGNVALGHDRALNKKDKGLLEVANDGEVRTFLMALIAVQPHLTARDAIKQCRDRFGDELVDGHGEMKPMPPERTFQYTIKKLREVNKVALTKLIDPDRFKSHYRLSGTGMLRYVTDPNQLWQIDASPVDALCVDGRYSVYACIDIATRRLIFLVSKTPRASAVGALIRKAVLKWGAPLKIVTDNGSDFVALETQRLFDFIGVDTERSDAYSPEQKGHIERAIKTFQHSLAPNMSGYVGHNPMDRKVIEGRKSFAKRLKETEAETFGVSMTAEELQKKIDEWVDLDYSHRPHGGVGMEGMSPAQKAANSSVPARMIDERALEVLLMPVVRNGGIRTHTKQGFEIDYKFFFCGTIMPGTKALVRHDPYDAGIVHAFTPDGSQHLGDAICPELTGINPASLVRAAREQQAELIEKTNKPVRKIMRELAKGPSFADRARAVDRRDAEKRAAEAANVIQMPKREEQHSTPAIAAAIDAVTVPQQSNEPKPLNEQAAAIHAALLREAEDRREAKVVHLDPDAGLTPAARRFKWAVELEGRIAAGDEIDHGTALELLRYQSTPSYQTNIGLMKTWSLKEVLLIAV